MRSPFAVAASLLWSVSLQNELVDALSLHRHAKGITKIELTNFERRNCLGLLGSALATALTSRPVLASPGGELSSISPSRAITNVWLSSPQVRAGVELVDETIGTPPRNVVAVRSVRLDGAAIRNGVQNGMILTGFDRAVDVVERIKNGPYPIDLRFLNLAAGGDAIGMEGRPIVSADDALRIAKQASGDSSDVMASPKGVDGMPGEPIGFVTKVLKDAEGKCGIQSRRGDVLEIRYEARVGNERGPIYDSSDWRGTGQPYMFNLGNGDVIRGVDLGLYDMCPGSIREISIPPELGYGQRGSKLFEIGGNSRLWWRVELVALNFVREGNNDSARENLYDGGSAPLPVFR